MSDQHASFEHLDRFVECHPMVARGFGMAIGLTDRERRLRVSTSGAADVAAGTPVCADTLFEIGSIGKSFTAIALLQLHEAGQLDLHAPVTDYLPWFRVRSRYAPITVHHLLSHTAGIVGGTDFSPDARYEVWAARETETGGPPGERFHYSNLGYKALGLLLAEVVGKPYAEIVRERILDPLDMTASSPVITHQTRRRLAVGYRPWYDDRPFRPTDPLAPATWLETDSGDAAVAATAGELVDYLRMLLNRGQGPRGRLLSAASFALMTRPVIEDEPGSAYGYGLQMTEIDGHACLGHGGGMVGYYAALLGDLEDGLGVVVLVNGPPVMLNETARFALGLLRAARHDEALPPLPPVPEPTRVDNAIDYAGTYR